MPSASRAQKLLPLYASSDCFVGFVEIVGFMAIMFFLCVALSAFALQGGGDGVAGAADVLCSDSHVFGRTAR